MSKSKKKEDWTDIYLKYLSKGYSEERAVAKADEWDRKRNRREKS